MSEILSHYRKLCAQTGRLAGISFELTNACNYACSHCYKTPGETFLSEDVFFKALDEAEELGAISVSFNGGEPTLHPNFLKWALHVLNRGMFLNILTNGSGLTPPALDALTAFKGLHIQLSLYGTDTASGEKITGSPLAFEQGFRLSLELANKEVNHRVAILALSETATALPKIIEHLVSLDVKIGMNVHLSATESGSNAPIALSASDEQLSKLLQYEGDWKVDLNESEGSVQDAANSELACSAAVTGLGIRVDGSIVPCLLFSEPVLGRIPADTLSAVMAGARRQAFLESNIFPEKCHSCEDKHYCFRCPADAVYETGSITGLPSQSCRLAHLRSQYHRSKQS